jgi:HlyD family secretion protein
MIKQVIVTVLAFAALIGGTLALFALDAPRLVATPAQSGAGLAASQRGVQAHGKVVPVNSVTLSFPAKGIVPEGFVSEVAVKPGAKVEQGALLARLDTRELELQIDEARAALAEVKANYDKLMAGATPEEIKLAKAQLAKAQAQAQQTHGNVTSQDLTAAQANLDRARANLAVVQAGTKPTRVQAAQAALNQARTKLQSQRDRLSADKSNAQLQMEQAANELRNRQASYSQVVWDNQARGDTLEQADIDREAAALRAEQDAEKALQAASINFEQAKQAEISGIAIAEAEVDSAQAFLSELQAGADADVLASARAQVAQAEAEVAKLQGEQRSGALSGAAADATAAQAALEKLTADPRTVDIALVQAQIQQAEVALKRQELMIDLASLRAPIAGTIVGINLKVGEVPSINEPGIVLADLSNWQIETTDLDESGMVRLHEGDSAKITFDSINNFTLTGKVVQIEMPGHTSDLNRNVIYTVVIKPDQQDPRLRWNMSALIEIAPRT